MCRAMRLPLDSFDNVKGESDSVGGLVLEIAGAFPEINSSVRAGNYLFTVLEISRNRITSVKVTKEA
jgi:putative hemolysin